MADQDISAAVDEATRLRDIGFAEFTADLVLKVFDGLVAANLSQTEAYVQLVQALGKTLSTYVNDTKDQIGGDEILAFLSAALPKDPTTGEPKQITDKASLSETDASALNTALALPTADGGATGDNKVAVKDKKVDDPAILEAVARRIAANKYDLLKEMVKLGILRLVITHGVIETKLTFSTYTSKFYQSNTSSFNTKQFNFNAKAKTGFGLSKWIKASASANYSTLSVRTTNETQQDVSGSRVDIFGLVHLEFKTDYQPLNA